MRETRLSGSEGGAGQPNVPSLPLFFTQTLPTCFSMGGGGVALFITRWDTYRFLAPSRRPFPGNSLAPSALAENPGATDYERLQRDGCGGQAFLEAILFGVAVEVGDALFQPFGGRGRL